MNDALILGLLSGLGRSSRVGFNVFDVMRHGSHEKQISDVFRWLLDPEASHGLGTRFQEVFIAELNRVREGEEPFSTGPYSVRQEVNTSLPGEDGDIADIVLRGDRERIVIENYYTSDGHGHSFDRYLRHAMDGGLRGAVVLLCQDEDSSLQVDGWERAAVLTYGRLLQELMRGIDDEYRQAHADAYRFIHQMCEKFVEGRGAVQDSDALEFVKQMCDAGEAERYRSQPHEVARDQFAEAVAREAGERFEASRRLLGKLKGRLTSFCKGTLRAQLEETLGAGSITLVKANWVGIYRWTVFLQVVDVREEEGTSLLQVKLGPSAWWASERDDDWQRTDDPSADDYAHLFVLSSHSRAIRRSAVTLRELTAGLRPDDRRLHDELLALWRDTRP